MSEYRSGKQYWPKETYEEDGKFYVDLQPLDSTSESFSDAPDESSSEVASPEQDSDVLIPKADTIETNENHYEVLERDSLRLNNIGRNDRAYIVTKSNTMYMVRFSQTDGVYKIYSHSHGLAEGKKILGNPEQTTSFIADKDSAMMFITENINPENNHSGNDWTNWQTTPISWIKLIRNVDSDFVNKKIDQAKLIELLS